MSTPILPPELAKEILLHLPIDPADIRPAAFASKALLAVPLLHDIVFARSHLRFQLQVHYARLREEGVVSANQPASEVSLVDGLWGFLHSNRIHGSNWLDLPLTYRIAIYGELMLAPDWVRVGSVMADGASHADLDLPTRSRESQRAANLMAFDRWPLSKSPERALLFVETLCTKFPGFSPEAQDSRLFRWTARSGHIAVVRWLLQNFPAVDPAADDNYAIKTAAEGNHLAVVSFLLKDPRCDPSAESNCALEYACEHGWTDIVKVLLADPRCSAEMNENHCFIFACRGGFIDIVRILMSDPRVDVAHDNNHGFELACAFGHADLVRLLLTDARVNPTDTDGAAFFLACENGHAAVVRALLADVRVDPQNVALALACENGHADVVELLLADARVDMAFDENLCIRVAAQNGHTRVAQLLLERAGCDSALRSEALRVSCDNGHVEIVKLLLSDSWRCAKAFVPSKPALESIWRRGIVELMRFVLANIPTVSEMVGRELDWLAIPDEQVLEVFRTIIDKYVEEAHE
ncbi:hypothetical protein HDU83_007654 [Entophlyctis luteolus]|nr:hypothetical protein HDU83_007654 [Entophlyctis luteolus]